MAGLALEKLEEELQCCICLDTYSDPRVLKCYHIYCQQCLTSLVVRDQQGQLSLTCPTCHQNSPLPATGVAGLQSAHHINPLLWVVEEHRKAKEISDGAMLGATALNSQLDKEGKAGTKSKDTTGTKNKEEAERKKTTGAKSKEEAERKKPKDSTGTKGKEEAERKKPKDTTGSKNKEEVERKKPKDSTGTKNKEEAERKKPKDRTGPQNQQEAFREKPKDKTMSQSQEAVKMKPKNKSVPQGQEAVKEKPQVPQSQEKEEGSAKDTQYCPVHPKKELTLFCETCEDLVCYKCALKGGKHYKHDCQEISEAYEKFKQEIAQSLEPMQKKLTTARQALKEFDSHSEAIANQEAAIETDIQLTVSELHKVLEERQKELLSQLNQITEGKLEDLDAQRKLMERTRAQLSGCLDFVKENPGSNQAQVLMRFQPDILEIKTEADVTFSASEELEAVVKNYGEVKLAEPADPSQCQATGKGLEAAVVGEKSTALLQAVGFDGKPHEQVIRSLECEIVSEITGTTARGSVERRGESQYEISYQPTVKGRHQLHVKISGQHIRGSPFSVAVKLPVEMFGTPLLSFGEVKSPSGVAINQKGEILVVEWNGHCISMFSRSGERLRSIGTRGKGNGQFEHPRGVAVDSDGNILVADTNNHRVQKLTQNGKFLTKAPGTAPMGLVGLTYPRGIAFNITNNKVYIVDANDRILVLNSDLSFHVSFGENGNGSGQFDRPSGIACDSSGDVYVADSWNNRVQIFTADLKFLKVIGPGSEDSEVVELKSPSGVTVDTSGLVYISDCNDQISVFTSEGELVAAFSCARAQGKSISSLSGLAVDASGVVYVCDSHKSVVDMF